MDNLFSENTAIVGNGSSEIGTGNGKHIDSFDKVMRFNNYILDNKFKKDYGKRTDYWCRTIALESNNRSGSKYIPVRDTTEYEKIFITSPKRNLKAMHKNIRKDLNITTFFPAASQKLLFKAIKQTIPNWGKPRPSTGIKALFWIYLKQGYINPDNVFGFNFLTRLPHIIILIRNENPAIIIME